MPPKQLNDSAIFDPTAAMDDKAPLEVTNYDVLFAKNSSIADEHVGNNRFEVMLNIHRGSFHDALARDNEAECELIIDKIIDIVCHKCVPNGRFLEKVGDEWIDLGEGLATRERIREALNQSSEVEVSVELQVPPITPNVELPEKLPSAPPRMASCGSTVPAEKSDFDKKRRRRGSLARLRRSISESMVPSMKNGIKPMPSLSRWKSERRSSYSKKHTTSASGIDVVFTADGLSLDPKETYVGNNRFRILLDMQTNKFTTSSSQEQSSIAFDLVDTVTRHWNGEFLRPGIDGLQRLNSVEAERLVLGLLRSRTTPAALLNNSAHAPEIQSMRSAAVKSLKARKQKQEITNRLVSQSQQQQEGKTRKSGVLPSSLKNYFQKR